MQKKFIACLICCVCGAIGLLKAQTEPFPTGVIFHLSTNMQDSNLITKTVVVLGKIVEVKQNPKNEDSFFLNFDAKFPFNSMALIANKTYYDGDWDALKKLEGKTVLVHGTVQKDPKYKYGNVALKPTIMLDRAGQIKIVADF